MSTIRTRPELIPIAYAYNGHSKGHEPHHCDSYRSRGSMKMITNILHYLTITRSLYSKRGWLERRDSTLRCVYTVPFQLAPHALNGSPSGDM